MKSKCFFLVCFLSLVGCTSTPPINYQMGYGGELKIVNNSPNTAVTLIMYQDDFDCFGQEMKSFVSYNVREMTFNLVEKPYQTFAYHYIGGTYTCSGFYTFRSDKVGNYVAFIAETEDGCRMSLRFDTGETLEPIEAMERQLEGPAWDNAGPWCKPDSRFRGSSKLVAPRGVISEQQH